MNETHTHSSVQVGRYRHVTFYKPCDLRAFQILCLFLDKLTMTEAELSELMNVVDVDGKGRVELGSPICLLLVWPRAGNASARMVQTN